MIWRNMAMSLQVYNQRLLENLVVSSVTTFPIIGVAGYFLVDWQNVDMSLAVHNFIRTAPVGILYSSWSEFAYHKWILHGLESIFKSWSLIRDHIDHHRKVNQSFLFEDASDYNCPVTHLAVFPVLFIPNFLFLLLVFWLLSWSYLLLIMIFFWVYVGYNLYESTHLAMHRKNSWAYRVPVVRLIMGYLIARHKLHHKQSKKNLAVTFPPFDWLFDGISSVLRFLWSPPLYF